MSMLQVILCMKNGFPNITETLVNDVFNTQSPNTYLCIAHVEVVNYTFKVTEEWM